MGSLASAPSPAPSPASADASSSKSARTARDQILREATRRADLARDGEETAEVGELQVEVVESSKTTSVSWNKTGLIQTPGTPTRSSAVKT